MKICSVCKIKKELACFAFDKTKKSGYNCRCKDCPKIKSNLHYINNKENYMTRQEKKRQENTFKLDSLKKYCLMCGDMRKYVLEFHHKEIKDKEYTIAAITNYPWLTIEKEVQKCIVLCANCHKELHFNEKQKTFYGKASRLATAPLLKSDEVNSPWEFDSTPLPPK